MTPKDPHREFIHQVIQEHPNAVRGLLREYHPNIPMTPESVFAMYVKHGDEFAHKLDAIDAGPAEISNAIGAMTRSAGKASQHLKASYAKLVDANSKIHIGHPGAAEEPVELHHGAVHEKSTYTIFGKEIHKGWVWGAGAAITIGIISLVAYLVTKKKKS